MVVKVGINGFGRIGRVIFRTCCQTPELEVSAINDPAIELEYICYLIKFDSTHGKYKGNVSYEGDEIKIDGESIKVFHHKSPTNIPWQDVGVQYVIEASGMFTNLEKASGHLAGESVRRVLVTAPSADVPMLILGVNEDRFNPDVKVVSCASSTLYCLAPLVKLLQDTFGVEEGFVTSIHAMTPSLKPLDGLCIRGKHWRDHRSIHQNIIPAATGACKALGRIIPAVRDRLSGLAFRVPIVNVSVLDLSIRLNKSTTIKEITECIEKQKASAWHNVMQVSKEQAVSSDFIGDIHSCTLDVDSSLQLRSNFFKLICWYENEYSYACRVVDTILFSERERRTPIMQAVTKMTYVRSRSCRARSEHQQTDSCKKHVGIECVSFPLLVPNTYDARVAKPVPRLIMSRPASAYASEANQPCDPHKGRGPLKNYNEKFEKACAVQSKICIHGNRIAPQKNTRKEYERDQDRLVPLKSENSNMVIIKEVLVKKSSSKKLESTFVSSLKTATGKANSSVHSSINVEFEKKMAHSFDKGNKEKQSNYINEVCGDLKSYQNIRDNDKSKSNSKSEIDSRHIPKGDNSNNVIQNNLPNITFDKGNTLSKPKNPVKEHNNILWNKTKQLKLNEDYKIQENEKVDNIMEGLGKTTKCNLYNESGDDKQNAGEVIHIISDYPESETASLGDSGQARNNDDESPKLSNSGIYRHESAEIKDVLGKAISNINIVDEKLKQRNIVLVDCVVEAARVRAKANENNKTIAAKEEAFKQIYKGPQAYSNDPISIVSEETSRCVSPVNTVTTISNVDTYRSKQDIYDKLDSASVSDSDNSFQMHEKKSQVINITDLNYSLEDLARLDKICRIIEISDELSDKLFAPLDWDTNGESSRKQWSFKDLCERIRLDDFCNNVFGKSAA